MDLIDISHLHKNFKDEAEKNKFMEAQHRQITELSKKIVEQEQEIKHLKELLTSNIPVIGEQHVEKIIVTPEQALIDGQIAILQNRSYGQELTLEEVKKLDLLLKNKNLIKSNDPKTLDGKSKNSNLTNEKLLEILAKNNGSK
jgi:predicted RNase H-like nuclease (RuvC/YqgF family)